MPVGGLHWLLISWLDGRSLLLNIAFLGVTTQRLLAETQIQTVHPSCGHPGTLSHDVSTQIP